MRVESSDGVDEVSIDFEAQKSIDALRISFIYFSYTVLTLKFNQPMVLNNFIVSYQDYSKHVKYCHSSTTDI